MKLKTFLRQAPLIAGAFATIFSVLFFVSCEASKKTKATKTPSLAFTLDKKDGTSDGNLNGKFAEEKKDGGKTKNLTYYQVEAPDGDKFFTLTASSKSKGEVAYTLQMVKDNGTLETAEKTAETSLPTDANKVNALAKGKVYFNTGQSGFFYLNAMQKEKGDYKKATAKVLLVVGKKALTAAWDTPSLDDDTKGNITGFENASGNPAVANTPTGSTVVATGGSQGNKFTRTVSVDTQKFPKEAPLPVFTYALDTTNGDASKVKLVDSTGVNTGQVELVARGSSQINAVVKTGQPYSVTASYTAQMP